MRSKITLDPTDFHCIDKISCFPRKKVSNYDRMFQMFSDEFFHIFRLTVLLKESLNVQKKKIIIYGSVSQRYWELCIHICIIEELNK